MVDLYHPQNDEYDPFFGREITAGDGPGQLPTRYFNILMRRAHTSTTLPNFNLAQSHHAINAKSLSQATREELEGIGQFGPEGFKAVQKALKEILEDF